MLLRTAAVPYNVYVYITSLCFLHSHFDFVKVAVSLMEDISPFCATCHIECIVC